MFRCEKIRASKDFVTNSYGSMTTTTVVVVMVMKPIQDDKSLKSSLFRKDLLC
ncbi:hypothetical protein QR98_0106350, partial [Sarcoptes scabiei]